MQSVTSNAVAKKIKWTKIDINYTATRVTTDYTTILNNVPDFDEAIIIASGNTLVLKKSTLDNSTAGSYMKYTGGGSYDYSYDLRVLWNTHELQFRQLYKGVDIGYAKVYEMYYR